VSHEDTSLVPGVNETVVAVPVLINAKAVLVALRLASGCSLALQAGVLTSIISLLDRSRSCGMTSAPL
jgi:hypothetical protein